MNQPSKTNPNPFTVAETFLLSKAGNPDGGDDKFADGEHFLVVADGATDKGAQIYDGKTGGRAVAEIICAVVSAADTGTTGVELVERINKEYVTRLGLMKDIPIGERPAGVFCAIDKTANRIIYVGDCSWRTHNLLVKGGMRIDDINGGARAAYLKAMILAGATVEELLADDPGRAIILPLLVAQAHNRNNVKAGELAYAAIDGLPMPAQFIEEWDVTRYDEIVIASDGYPDLDMSLAVTEQTLAADIKEDPLRIGRNFSTKGISAGNVSFDDRAWVKLIKD